MQQKPKISIITPTYNCGHLIKRCIESVQLQKYPNFEHIVVDGASTDQTVEMLQTFRHIRWVSEKDTGEANALNKALKMVTGDIVCWLNADDWLVMGCFDKVAEAFMKNPSWEIVFGNTEMVDEKGRIIWLKKSTPHTDLRSFVRWWTNACQPHQPSMFFKTDLLRRVGPLNESLHFSIDLELWLRCALLARFNHIDKIFSKACQRTDCKSADTVPQQIESHWKVVVPYLQHLSHAERVEFWFDYYSGRITGEMPNVREDPCRFPDTEEALLGLLRTISLHRTNSVAILAYFFPDEKQLLAVAQLLVDRGITFNQQSLAVGPDLFLHHGKRASKPTVVIDGSVFSDQKGEQSRLWAALLESWSKTELASRLVVLDRAGYAPRVEGIRYRLMPQADLTDLQRETLILNAVCAQEEASLFISTYLTSVTEIPSVRLVCSGNPKRIAVENVDKHWDARRSSNDRASAFCCISDAARADLLELFPNIEPTSVAVTVCGIDTARWSTIPADSQGWFKNRFGLSKPYFVLRNASTAKPFFEAITRLGWEDSYHVFIPGANLGEEEREKLGTSASILTPTLNDEELRVALAGATALVYLPEVEDFGLSVLEAMAVGCPVITTTQLSLASVAGPAALYADTTEALTDALCEVQKPKTREMLIDAGREQARRRSQETLAQQLQTVIDQVIVATSNSGTTIRSGATSA